MTEIHPRIHERHPELTNNDISYAWEHPTLSATRIVKERELRVGFDLKGREIEMVGALTADGWLVYHGMTPPTKKTRKELEMAKGGR